MLEQLEKLAEMHERGLLDEVQFEASKNKLLLLAEDGNAKEAVPSEQPGLEDSQPSPNHSDPEVDFDAGTADEYVRDRRGPVDTDLETKPPAAAATGIDATALVSNDGPEMQQSQEAFVGRLGDGERLVDYRKREMPDSFAQEFSDGQRVGVEPLHQDDVDTLIDEPDGEQTSTHGVPNGTHNTTVGPLNGSTDRSLIDPSPIDDQSEQDHRTVPGKMRSGNFGSQATAKKPSSAANESLTLSRVPLLSLLGGAVIVLGALVGPWVSVSAAFIGTMDIGGASGDGLVFVLVGLLIGGLGYKQRAQWLVAFLGLGTVAYASWQIANLYSTFAEEQFAIAQPGWGLYAMIAGGVLAWCTAPLKRIFRRSRN